MVRLADPDSFALPYGADIDTLRAHVACRYRGAHPPRLRRKQLTALRLAPDITLSVPVAGGNRPLRALEGTAPTYRDLDRIVLSEHDNWRRRHIAALQTRYSALPYFIHFAPDLFRAISEARTLGELLCAVAAPLDLFITERLLDQLTKSRESRVESREVTHQGIDRAFNVKRSSFTASKTHHGASGVVPWLETLMTIGPRIIFEM